MYTSDPVSRSYGVIRCRLRVRDSVFFRSALEAMVRPHRRRVGLDSVRFGSVRFGSIRLPPRRCSEGEEKAAAVFQVMQIDPTFVNGDLAYMRAELFFGARLCITGCSLTGGKFLLLLSLRVISLWGRGEDSNFFYFNLFPRQCSGQAVVRICGCLPCSGGP